MKISIRLAPLALAAIASLGLVGLAEAAPGKARTLANVRSGPGNGYAIVDTLTRGERVDVVSCGVAWCKVSRVGPDGYVSRGLLYNPYYGSKLRYQFPPSTPSAGRNTNNR